MENNLIKQAGIALIFVLGGFLIWLLNRVGSLDLSLGDIALVIVLVSGGGYVLYCIIVHFTGAKVSDITKLKETLDKLLDILKGEEESDSTGNTGS